MVSFINPVSWIPCSVFSTEEVSLQNSTEQPQYNESSMEESCDMAHNQDGSSALYNAVVSRLPRVHLFFLYGFWTDWSKC